MRLGDLLLVMKDVKWPVFISDQRNYENISGYYYMGDSNTMNQLVFKFGSADVGCITQDIDGHISIVIV